MSINSLNIAVGKKKGWFAGPVALEYDNLEMKD
jgi:hypothetical protein